MDAAAEWGKAPWEFAPGGRALWWARWQAYRAAKIKIESERVNALKRKGRK